MKFKANCMLILLVINVVDISAASKFAVRGQHGMVVSSHELASQVGIDVLKKGGNAVDAAVAMGYALAVVFPTAGNLGGGGFMVIRFPDGETSTIDFREKAPLKAHRNMYLDENGDVNKDLSLKGYLASGVPGTVAGLNMALEKYGTRSLKKIIAPAIKLAEHGFTVSAKFGRDLIYFKDDFLEFPASARTFLKSNGEPYQEGDIFKQSDLARTLKIIADKGVQAFYHGQIAELIARDMAKNGGIITLKDLAGYEAKERLPVKGSYRGYEVISMGPPSSGGITVIETLNILENFNLSESGFGSSQTIHIFAEALKRSFCDRAMHLGDMDYHPVPIEKLLEKSYILRLSQSIDSAQAKPAEDIHSGIPGTGEGNHTTHYSVIDENEMAVCVTTTINTGYGSKVVIDGAGFLMNNEMDDFACKPGSPNSVGLVTHEANAIEPGKRMLSSMAPTIIEKNGKVFMTVGSMGGPAIITAVLQIISNVIDHGMTVQEAVDAPRIHHQWLPDRIDFERFAISMDVLEKLQRMGHVLMECAYESEAHAILRDENSGFYWGAVDPRFEGKAMGY